MRIKIFSHIKMIKSEAVKNLIKAKQNLVLPIRDPLGPPQQKGSLAYEYSSDVLNYSTGQAWLPLVSGSSFPLTPENYITVHPTFSGADFTTIKDALAFATTLLPTVSAVMVYPSTYTEDNPLTVPNTVSVIGLSGPLGAMVIAQNPLSNLFDLGNGCVIQELTLVGGAIALNYDGSTGTKAGSIARALIIIDATIGVRSFVGPGELICLNSLVRANVGTVTTGFECISGGKLRCFSCGAFGLPLNKITTGVSCSGLNSQCVYFTSGFQLCVTSAFVDDNARLEIKSSFVRLCDTALKVGPLGTSTLYSDDASLLNSTIYDLDVQSSLAKIQIYGGQLRTDLINNPLNAIIFSDSYSNEPFNEALQLLGDLHVGDRLQPTETTSGGGDAYTNGMTVLTDDGTGTNFMNITTSAKNPTINTPFLQGLAVGNVIYIGSVTNFFGFDTTVSTTWAVGDSDNTAKEYWNGAWTALALMTTKASAPYSSRTNVMLETVEKQSIRFGKTTGWVVTTVNGISAFWIRVRVTALLTGPIPLINKIALHPSSTKINKDGFVEYLGDSRPIKMIPWDLGQLEPAVSSPGDQDVYISDNLDIGKTENLFMNAVIDRSGFNTFLPREIDTSYGVKFRWSWMSSATGGLIDWVVRWGWTNDGFAVYDSTITAPAVGVNEQSISFSTAVVVALGIQVTETRTLSIPKVNARPSSGNPDMLWITLERNGLADTHTGNVALIQVQGEYIAFCEGGHVSEF